MGGKMILNCKVASIHECNLLLIVLISAILIH
jgi:hypothetical protein